MYWCHLPPDVSSLSFYCHRGFESFSFYLLSQDTWSVLINTIVPTIYRDTMFVSKGLCPLLYINSWLLQSTSISRTASIVKDQLGFVRPMYLLKSVSIPTAYLTFHTIFTSG
jgi:hypothetical protein